MIIFHSENILHLLKAKNYNSEENTYSKNQANLNVIKFLLLFFLEG